MIRLISTIGFGLFVVGLFATILVAYASIWKTQGKKVKLSHKDSTRFAYLIGATSILSGIGITVSITAENLPEFSTFRTILLAVACIGVFPLIMVGVYTFDVKYYGYVQSKSQENKK